MRQWYVRIAMAAAVAAMPASALYGQPSKGDKEVGIAGSLIIQNSSPSSGSFIADFTGGKYFRDNQYLGAFIQPQISFTTASGGANTGSFLGGIEYESGFKAKGKLWPYVGGSTGFEVFRASGGGGSSWSGYFLLAPEAGVKYFLDNKTSLNLVFQVPILMGNGGVTSQTQILFGFRHIL